MKGKGKKERYIHLYAEFQRTARRNKKAFLHVDIQQNQYNIVKLKNKLNFKKSFISDQCKEIEENNTMGKARDIFKKIRDTKGRFH